jgi:polar amino acid transport system substrate-binding protein
MMKQFLSATVLLVAATMPAAADDKTVILDLYPIPVMVIDANTGVFVDLAKELAKRARVAVSIEVVPARRAVDNFERGEVDALLPGLSVLLSKPYVASAPIYIKRDFVFSKSPQPLLTTIDTLAGKRVGITLGYPYAREVIGATTFSLDTAATDEINFGKLDAGRIDAFIDEEKTGLGALHAAGLTGITYDPAHPVSQQEVFVAFHDTPDGHTLADQFSAALADFKADGGFARLMARTEQP